MTATRRAALALSIALAPPSLLSAQATQPRDTIDLVALQRAAREHDPRIRQLTLLTEQADLRLSNIAADKKPTFLFESQGQVQSDVAKIPVSVPNVNIPTPPYDTYDAHLGARYRIYDATVHPRRAVEQAQLDESRARVNTALYTSRQNVNDAFFAVLRADAQRADVETSITDLEAQITVAAARVRAGSALPSEERILRAELLRRRQNITELSAARAAAIDILVDLTGQRSVATSAFTLPAIDLDTTRMSELIANPRTRPELQQFAATRELLDRQREARGAQEKPRISAFGRAGIGRPGLNPLGRTFDTYWLGGLQVEWMAWNWGVAGRDREILAIQQRIVDADEQAFRQSLRRATRQDVETIARLERELVSDDEIIVLRESVLSEARARFNEAVITSSELVDRQTDVLSARLTRSIHRVELAQARARFLTTLGVEAR